MYVLYVSRLLRRAVKKQLRAQSQFCHVQTIPGHVDAIFHRRQPASALIFLNCFGLTSSSVISVLLKTLPFHKFHYFFQFHKALIDIRTVHVYIYTVSPKKYVTTFSTIILTIIVRLQ